MNVGLEIGAFENFTYVSGYYILLTHDRIECVLNIIIIIINEIDNCILKLIVLFLIIQS